MEDNKEIVRCAICNTIVLKSKVLQRMEHDNPYWGDWSCLKYVHGYFGMNDTLNYKYTFMGTNGLK